MWGGAITMGSALCLVSALGAVAEPLSFDDCEARLDAEPASQEAAECFYLTAKRLGQWEEAARRLAARLESLPDSPWLHFQLGMVLWHHDTCAATTRQAFQDAAEHFARLQVRDRESLARINLARLLARCGEFDAAEAALERAEEAARSSRDLMDPVRVQETRIRLRERMGGDLETAYHDLRRLWDVTKDPDLDAEPRIWNVRKEGLTSLAEICSRLGRYREEQDWNRLHLDLARRAGDRHDEVALRFNLVRGPATHKLPTAGDRSAYLEELHEILPLARETGYPEMEAKIRLLIAKLEGGGEAAGHLERCRQLAEKLGDDVLRRRCLLARAAQLSDSDPDASRSLLSQLYAEGLFVSNDPKALVLGRDDHLQALWRSYSRDDALAGAERILADVEALRRPQTGLARAEILAVWSDTYAWLAGSLLREAAAEGRAPRRAFALMERLRAQELREVLLLAGEASPWLPPPRPDVLDRVMAALHRDEVMLSFQLALGHDVFGRFAGGSWVLVSSREETRVHRLELDREKIEPAVETLVEKKDGRWHEQTLIGLHEVLLEPALGELGSEVRRLVINPDGILHLLPFAALRGADGRALGESYDLSVIPSADLWLRWKRGGPGELRPAALVLADPELPTAASSVPEAGATPRAEALGELRFAAGEGRKVSRHLRRASRLLLGGEASELSLKQADLEPFGLLHFATHAVVDDEKPWLSGVLLARGDDSQDGWLRPEEIAELDLEGKAVVLSTCNSAAGGWLLLSGRQL